MRAISFFNLEAGTSTFAWRAMSAFLTRVSISAMGSAVITSFQHLSLFLIFREGRFARPLRLLLPARLRYARNFPGQGELAETDTAQRKLTKESTRTAAVLAPVTQ